MNAPWNHRQSYLTLVDDDAETARLLTRMLLAHGAPSVRWLDRAAAGQSELAGLLAAHQHLPDLVIVDLKATPNATASFVRGLRARPYGHYLMVAAMTPARERHQHEMLLSAGADTVIERAVEGTDYRGEAARLVSYWVRSQRLDAVGA